MKRLRVRHAHPIVLHPDIVQLSGHLSEVLDRFEFYATRFAELGGRGKLVIFLNCTEDEYRQLLVRKFSGILVFRIGNPGSPIVLYALTAIRIILREHLRPSILIAGDLKRGLIASLLLKSLYGFHLRIQVSIHGIPFGFRDEESRKIHDFIPWIYLRITLPFVDSIRIVSVHLQETMRESFGIPNAKVFIAPIPIIQKPDQLNKSKKPIHIGIIGRLHPERGIDELIRILSICLEEFPNTRVTFFGTGEMLNNVNKWKLNNIQFQNISLRGHVSPSKLLEEWPRITHVLSTAPSEGYGLTLREALLSGAVVIAKANQGTRELKDKFVSGIYLYTTEQDACKMLMRILHGVDDYTYCADAHFLQEQIDSSSMDLLAKSWMH